VAATSAAQAIQASADALTKAWEDYTPAPYPHGMLLIKAGIRDFRPSVIDDDPSLGWSPMIAGELKLRTMNAHHPRMIFPEHAQELAAVLADHLPFGPHAPAARSDSGGGHPHGASRRPMSA
jgi:thioesterase domain-containing protein